MLRHEKDISEACPDVFEQYRFLVSKADSAFRMVERDYGACVKCRIGCSDCCHAIFGVFMIEAVHLKQGLDQLGNAEREAALLRADEADHELKEVEEKLAVFDGDPHMKAFALAKERVRCPLLDPEDKCIIYHYRPITCRVYGIPTAIQGRGRVCGKAAFEKGKTYPVYNLDAAYRGLYRLSRELIERANIGSADKASLMLSLSRVIKTPTENLLE